MNVELDLPQGHAWLWLWLLIFGLPTLIIVGTLVAVHPSPGGAPAFTALLVLPPILLIAATLHVFMHRQRAWIEDGVLHVVSTFYHRRIPLADLDLERARVLSLLEQPQWKPWLRTNGFAIPGMISGWYRLRDWRKAFAAYGDPSRVLCIDTGAYLLMLGARSPTDALEALRRARDEVHRS
jgi:hypothetical protein